MSGSSDRGGLSERCVDPDPQSAVGFPCDFCGDVVPSVRRVALDGDYERLATRHQVRYACTRCSDKKERQRIGFERG